MNEQLFNIQSNDIDLLTGAAILFTFNQLCDALSRSTDIDGNDALNEQIASLSKLPPQFSSYVLDMLDDVQTIVEMAHSHEQRGALYFLQTGNSYTNLLPQDTFRYQREKAVWERASVFAITESYDLFTNGMRVSSQILALSKVNEILVPANQFN